MHTPQTKRAKSEAPAARRKSAAPMNAAEAQRTPAYARRKVQPKVAVGPANNSFEQEADSVAQRVASGQNVASDAISSVPSAANRMPQRAPKQVPEPPLPALDEKKPVQKSATKPEEKQPQKPVQKSSTPPDTRKPLQKAEAKNAPGSAGQQMGEHPSAATRDSITQGGDQEAMAEAAGYAIANKGPGRPLDAGTMQTLSQRMGIDLNHVRIHDGPDAHEACRALHARAFTHGNDIWLGPGESDTDILLMAHEVTHVVQQTDHVHRKPLQRNGSSAPPFGAQNSPQPPVQRAVAQRKDPPAAKPGKKKPKEITIDAPVQTEIDAGDLATVKAKMPGGVFRRARGYNPNSSKQKPGQTALWDSTLSPAVIADRLRSKLGMTDNGLYSIRAVGPSGYERIGTPNILAPTLKRPFWNEEGAFMPHEVDHKVDLVFTGYPNNTAIGNSIDNMELLDAKSNSKAGTADGLAITMAIDAYLKSPKVKEEVEDKNERNRDALRARYDIIFTNLRPVPKRKVNFLSVYTREDIEKNAIHIDYLKSKKSTKILVHDLNDPHPSATSAFSPIDQGMIETRIGSKKLFRLYTKPGGGRNVGIKLPAKKNSVFIYGYDVQKLTLDPDASGDIIGSLEGKPKEELNKYLLMRGTSPWPIRKFNKDDAFKYAGYLVQPPLSQLDVIGASPVRITTTYVDDEKGLTIIGQVLPTIPVIRDLGIDLIVQGEDIRMQRTFQAGDFKLPGPIKATGGSVTLSLGTQTGLAVEGQIDLEIEKVGEGFIRASAGTKKGFALEGEFTFDPKLVDKGTKIRAWYNRENGEYDFGIAGEMHIKEGKIKGVKSATIAASYGKGKFTADGSADLSMKGLKQATLHLDYDAKEGLNVTGSLQLEETSLVRSGSGTVTLKKRDGDDYHVSGAGTIVPNVPGVSVAVMFWFMDDAFQAEGTVGFEKGMLKGAVTLGATNRPIGDDGKPADGPAGDIRIYGGGTLTLKLASWLEATAGIHILPNGEIEMVGKIGLPKSISIFDEKSFNQTLFSIGIDIPIIGISVAGHHVGIFATVGGGLYLNAGIGPGEIQELGVEVTYNPSHEEDTHISGGAKLHIPAHAGLKLIVRGGVGAGIPFVDATATIAVGGELGLAGALDASVQVDWSPRQGLVIDAKGSIFVEPTLKFDVTGSVSVDFDYFVGTKNLYYHEWKLASFEWGSGLRFGVEFPIHYEEGKAFHVSLDDLKFTVPEIDPMDVLSGLIEKVTG